MTDGRIARVLVVNHVGEISGAENSLLTLARHLDRARIEPVAAVPAGPLARALEDLEVAVSLIPDLRLSRPANPWQLLVGGWRLRRWAGTIDVAARELGADVVAANSVTAALGAALAVGGRLPVVWHARDLRAPEGAVRKIVRRVRRIIAISRCVADNLIDNYAGARDRVIMVYNGVDMVQFRPTTPRAQVREELGIPADAVLIGSVGQLVPWKRQDLFIEAAARISAHLPGAWFVIVGADLFGEHPEYVRQLRDLAADLGLGERLLFTGYREDVASIMNAMDLLLHTAQEEPLGRVVMEAMSLGVPCIAADSCGPAEIIEDGVSGVLVPPGEADAFATRTLELLRRSGALERMGEAARRRIDGRFSAERMARMTEDAYEEAWTRGPR